MSNSEARKRDADRAAAGGDEEAVEALAADVWADEPTDAERDLIRLVLASDWLAADRAAQRAEGSRAMQDRLGDVVRVDTAEKYRARAEAAASERDRWHSAALKAAAGEAEAESALAQLQAAVAELADDIAAKGRRAERAYQESKHLRVAARYDAGRSVAHEHDTQALRDLDSTALDRALDKARAEGAAAERERIRETLIDFARWNGDDLESADWAAETYLSERRTLS